MQNGAILRACRIQLSIQTIKALLTQTVTIYRGKLAYALRMYSYCGVFLQLCGELQ